MTIEAAKRGAAQRELAPEQIHTAVLLQIICVLLFLLGLRAVPQPVEWVDASIAWSASADWDSVSARDPGSGLAQGPATQGDEAKSGWEVEMLKQAVLALGFPPGRAASGQDVDCRAGRTRAPLTLLVCTLMPLILTGTAATAGEKTFEDGRRAYDFGEFSTAKVIWSALAQSGDAKSQASLGYLYREGKGVPRNSKLAAFWYYQAALRDEPTAQSALCDMHLKGEAVRRDFQAAFFWCELSIEGGETSGIELRERALNQITTEQRDKVWEMIVKWRAIPRDKACYSAAAEDENGF